MVNLVQRVHVVFHALDEDLLVVEEGGEHAAIWPVVRLERLEALEGVLRKVGPDEDRAGRNPVEPAPQSAELLVGGLVQFGREGRRRGAKLSQRRLSVCVFLPRVHARKLRVVHIGGPPQNGMQCAGYA